MQNKKKPKISDIQMLNWKCSPLFPVLYPSYPKFFTKIPAYMYGFVHSICYIKIGRQTQKQTSNIIESITFDVGVNNAHEIMYSNNYFPNKQAHLDMISMY